MSSTSEFMAGSPLCVCLLLQDLLQSCSRGGRRRVCVYYCRTYYKVEDMCYLLGGMSDDEPRPVWMSLLITH